MSCDCRMTVKRHLYDSNMMNQSWHKTGLSLFQSTIYCSSYDTHFLERLLMYNNGKISNEILFFFVVTLIFLSQLLVTDGAYMDANDIKLQMTLDCTDEYK